MPFALGGKGLRTNFIGYEELSDLRGCYHLGLLDYSGYHKNLVQLLFIILLYSQILSAPIEEYYFKTKIVNLVMDVEHFPSFLS